MTIENDKPLKGKAFERKQKEWEGHKKTNKRDFLHGFLPLECTKANQRSRQMLACNSADLSDIVNWALILSPSWNITTLHFAQDFNIGHPIALRCIRRHSSVLGVTRSSVRGRKYTGRDQDYWRLWAGTWTYLTYLKSVRQSKLQEVQSFLQLSVIKSWICDKTGEFPNRKYTNILGIV